MSQLRTKSSTTRVFLLSGLGSDARKEIARKIAVLGGKYFDLQDFKAICTHVICGKLSRSEKFLGACATGKWVLHPDYVDRSAAAGVWLDEEQYEWCDVNIERRYHAAPADLALASRRWRFLLGDQKGAFTGWKVAVVAGAQRSKVIKRLLISGGAQVFNLKLPVKNPEKVANTIGYIFVSEQSISSVSHLFEYGVLCIKPEFIGDYLIKDPPADPMDYLASRVSQDTSLPLSQDSFLPSSQSDYVPSSPSSKLSTTKMDNLVLAPVSSTLSSSPNMKVLYTDPSMSKWEYSPIKTTCSQSVVTFSPIKALSSQSAGTSQGGYNSPLKIISLQSSVAEVSQVIDLTDTDSDDADNVTAVVINKSRTGDETGAGVVRKSARNIGVKSSPVWKLLIPGSRKADKKEEIGQADMKHTKVDMEMEEVTEAKVRVKLDPKVKQTSTPAKAENRRGLFQKNMTSNMSPITKFFKPLIVPKMEQADETGAPVTNTDMEVEPCTDTNVKDVTPVTNNYMEVEACIDTNVKALTSSEKHEADLVTGGDIHIKTVRTPEPYSLKSVTEIISKSRKTDKTGNNDNIMCSSSYGDNGVKSSTIPESSSSLAKEKLVPQEVKRSRRVKAKASSQSAKTVSLMDYISNSIVTGDRTRVTETQSSSDGVDTKENACPGGVDTKEEKMTRTGMVTPKSLKKRKSHHDSDLHGILRALKRQKVSNCEWRPMMFAYNHRLDEDVPDAVRLPTTTTDIIHSTLEDRFTMTALHELNARVSFKYFPQPETLGTLMNTILVNAETELEANLSYQILCKVLRLHPPITGSLQALYLQAMSWAGQGEEGAIGKEWDMIKNCIGCVLTEGNTCARRNNVLLLKFIIQLLRHNLQYHLFTGSQGQADVGSRHMLLRILWCPSYHVVFNTRCRELFDLMADTISICTIQTVDTERQILSEVMQDIVWLVAMTTECCRILEGGNTSGVGSLAADKTSLFVHEITRRLGDGVFDDRSVSQCVLTSLQLPWLCVGVCQQLLNTMDDYLLTEDQGSDAKCISLSIIVSRYLFLLPRFHVSLGSKQTSLKSTVKRARQCDRPENSLKCLYENTDVNIAGYEKLRNKANKKNAKGETVLHGACIKNNVVELKRLLKVPGIDVNVKDNAGWTPLHEACNHGSLECVKELVKFVPSKTVDHFFIKGTVACKKVDLMAVNGEGITPLHDAVINERLEVGRVLLQHGGARLLSAVTCLGYTPLDLANTDKMYTMLLSFTPVQRRISESQESFVSSQDSSMSIESCRTEMPSEHLYERVTYMGSSRIYSDTKAALTYIHLVTQLFKFYIFATDLDVVKCKRRKLHSLNKLKCNQGLGSCDKGSESQPNCSDDTNCLPCSSITNHCCSLPGANSNQDVADERACGSQTAEKENMPITDITITKDVKNQDFLNMNASYSDYLPNVPEENIGSHMTVTNESVKEVKRDLQVVKDISQHIHMFKSHLYKLCRPADKEVIDSELLELSFLVDNLQDT